MYRSNRGVMVIQLVGTFSSLPIELKRLILQKYYCLFNFKNITYIKMIID